MDDNDSRVTLEHCDFNSVANELREMLRLAEAEAKANGEETYYDPKFLAALYPFLENPSRETAGPLLKCAPETRHYFEAYSPGGQFAAYQEILGDLANHSHSAGSGDPSEGKSPLRSELRAALQNSLRTDAKAPKVWWLIPVMGIVVGLGLLRINSPLGITCLAIMIGLLIIGYARAHRNRKLS